MIVQKPLEAKRRIRWFVEQPWWSDSEGNITGMVWRLQIAVVSWLRWLRKLKVTVRVKTPKEVDEACKRHTRSHEKTSSNAALHQSYMQGRMVQSTVTGILLVVGEEHRRWPCAHLRLSSHFVRDQSMSSFRCRKVIQRRHRY